MHRWLVIGHKGQLGSDVMELLTSRGANPLGMDLPELDVGDFDATRAKLLELKPDVVINTSAYHLVDKCEEHFTEAFHINAAAPRNLAKICEDLNATLMHFSTDYVFGGQTLAGAWTETDRPEPQSIYATSKLAGEHLVRENCEKHFVIRTCGLYGKAGRRPVGGSFVETMIRLSTSGKPLQVVNDQTVAPTSTAELAMTLLTLIDTGRYGLYHLTNAGECTWYDFAQEIFRLIGATPTVTPVSTAQYGAKAKRPVYSILDNHKATSLGVPAMSHWKEALATYIKKRT